MTHEQWEGIVNSMIEAFKLMIVEDNESRWLMTKKEQYYHSKNRRKKINHGLRMFIKYYHNLWY
jgi:hypothetical protein